MAQNDIFSGILQSIAPQQNMRDYQHASRTFVDSLYRLSPKYSNLFHVFIDVNRSLASQLKVDQLKQIEIGLMAKQVQLPKFTVTTKTHNAYNRKIVQQEKVSYDPVAITFHDDSADVVLNFWTDYFQYYYRDSDYPDLATYQYDSKYKPRQEQRWGFSPKYESNNMPYLNSIRIYSLHQKRFSSYTLVRPIITNFAHGQHVAGEYSPLEHTLTVNYEALQYESGPVSNGTVQGFDQIHYDTTPSPLRNAGALIGAGRSILSNIENGDLASVLQNATNATNILNGSNFQLKQTPSFDLSQVGNSILRGKNPFSTVFAPTSSSVEQGLRSAVTRTTNL